MLDESKRKRANLYDTIFIHIPKNAGVSVNTHLGMEDKNHQLAWRVRRWLGRDEWDKVFSFTVVRNPFDRAVSIWSAFGRAKPFHQWLWDNAEEDGMLDLRQWPWVTDPATGDLIVKMVLHFEAINVYFPGIPHLNAGAHIHYSEMYGPDEVAIIQERCERDFELFHYLNKLP